MPGGNLPSTRSRVRNALGSLRDTLGGLSNLDQLLRSPRVAPKALSAVLPDVLTSFPPLELDLQAAFEVLRVPFDNAAVQSLEGFLLRQVNELKQALGAAQPGTRPMSASVRLGLERVVGQAQHNLIGALPLLELMTEVAFGSRVTLDLHELLVLLRAGDQSHGLRGQVVQAAVAEESVPLTLFSSPRSALTLIALSATLANEKHSPPELTIRLAHTEDGTAQLSLTAASPETPRLRMVLPPLVAPTEACLRAIASVMGMSLTRSEGFTGLTWLERRSP